MKRLAILLVLLMMISPVLSAIGCGEEEGGGPLAAAFVGVPTSGAAPLTVQFADQSTGDIDTWAWDFGDEGTSSERNPSHVYDTVGTYTVSLVVTGAGISKTETRPSYITVTAISADFTATPVVGQVPLAVQFTDQSLGDITDWLWDFGDGAISNDKNPSHTYDTIGTYDVSLKVIGPQGSATESKTSFIDVTAEQPPAMTPVTWKLCHGYSADTPRGRAADKFKELVEQYTDGKVTVEVYPAGTLYGYGAALEAVTLGTIQVTTDPPYFVTSLILMFQLCYLDGFWEGEEHTWRVFNDPAWIARCTEELAAKGLHYLCMAEDSPTSVFVNNSLLISSLDQLAGLKWGQSAGATPAPWTEWAGVQLVTVSRAEMISAYETGVIDIYAGSLGQVVAYQSWDWTGGTYAFTDNGMALSSIFLMNQGAWEDLPAYYQNVITNTVVPQLMEYNRQDVASVEGGNLEALIAGFGAANVHQQTAAESGAAWVHIQETSGAKAILAEAGPYIVKLIDDLRPSKD